MSNQTRVITLGEMIPTAAWPALEALIHSQRRTASDFTPVLARYRAEMEARGVVPEYAAYVLEFVISQVER